MAKRIISAIDVGTTKVATLVANVKAEDDIEVLGVGVVPSHGLHKGIVVNMDEAKQSIATSVKEAQRGSGIRVDSAYVGVTGRHISSLNNKGVIAIPRDDRLVRPQDLMRALSAARNVTVAEGKRVLHAIPRYYALNGQEGVKQPVGMHASRLDVETHIITASVTSIQNLAKCVRSIGVDVEDLILEPLASGEAVLTAEERDTGVILADMGGRTTDIAVFKNGSIYHTAIVPGIDTNISGLHGLDAEASLHFVLNNKIYEDNRIPPRGFNNIAFEAFGGAPVGHHYDDGQYWDDTLYTLPVGATRAEVNLFYQSTSKEFVEFLRDENRTTSHGQMMYDLWATNGMCPPTLMAEATWLIAFGMRSAQFTPLGRFRMEFLSRPGLAYTIEFRDSLASGNWQGFVAMSPSVAFAIRLSQRSMPSAKVVVRKVKVHLFLQTLYLLGESDGLSGDTIIVLSQSQVQSFDQTGRDELCINIFPENYLLDYLF